MLNPEQTQVAEHLDGPCLVAAVAGSGKTHAVIARIVNMVQVGVDPRRILAITFSKNGADEMNARLEHELPGSGARVGTFHSVAFQILRDEGKFTKEWTVDDRNKYAYCIKEAIGWQGMDWDTADATVIANFIGLCKAQMARRRTPIAIALADKLHAQFGSSRADARKLNEAYARAEILRIERRLLTFDDMLFDVAEILQADDEMRRRWASHWDYVIQDEAQDQNPVQLALGELFAQDHRNYMLVGDPAQAIFGFRGAVPDMLMSFEKRWNANVIRMGRNYRCGDAIIDLANRSLATMEPGTHLGIEMLCERGTKGIVTDAAYIDLDDEAEHIADDIANRLADGTPPSDIAVLYRVGAQSRAPEEALIGRRIPYRVVGGTNFYQRKEVADLLAYLRIAAGRGTISDVRRSIGAPNRYLGRKFTDAVEQTSERMRQNSWPNIVRATCDSGYVRLNRKQDNAANEWADLIEWAMEKINGGGDDSLPARILETIIMDTSYTDWLVRDEGEESVENSRVSNVRELIRAAGRFPNVSELLDYIDDVIAASKRHDDKDRNMVTLTTIHRAKGLEWGTVYFIGCNDSIIPHARAEDIGEEHRLFYVAVTRARDVLKFSAVASIAIGNKIVPVSQIGRAHV